MTRRALRIVFMAGMLATMLPPRPTSAADHRPVVAVFDIQTKFLGLPKVKRAMLTELLGQELGVEGVYQVMPPGDVKRELLKQSAESYKECYDEKCQIELGRQLPANKLVTTTVMKVGGMCRVASSLYDLRRQTTDIVAKEKCSCDEEGLIQAVEKVATKLRAFREGAGTKPDFVEEELGEKPAGDWDPGAGQEVIVQFSSDPEGAVVLVDGNLVCQQTPCSKSVSQGKRLVAMQAPRYAKRQDQVMVATGTKLAWKLEPNFGWLTVLSDPPGLSVLINGKSTGSTPLKRLELEPGVYDVLVTSKCHFDSGKKVRVEKGQEQAMAVSLQEKQGAVKVSAKDEKGNDLVAEVFVDGQKIGVTPGTYKVSVCANGIKLVDAEKREVEESLDIREHQTLEKVLVLKGPGRSAGEIQQPGTNLYWLRCPVGQKWNGDSCTGPLKSANWREAMQSCPTGYRLPTAKEFATLLGSCNTGATNGGRGSCTSCSSSKVCAAMFGKDRRLYWSSSTFSSGMAVSVYFGQAAVSFGYDSQTTSVGNNLNYYIYIRCVRDGD